MDAAVGSDQPSAPLLAEGAICAQELFQIVDRLDLLHAGCCLL
jgi:hypothetical protein